MLFTSHYTIAYILRGPFQFQEEEEKNLEQRIQELLKYEDGKKVLFGIFTLAIKPTQGKKFGKTLEFSLPSFLNGLFGKQPLQIPRRLLILQVNCSK